MTHIDHITFSQGQPLTFQWNTGLCGVLDRHDVDFDNVSFNVVIVTLRHIVVLIAVAMYPNKVMRALHSFNVHLTSHNCRSALYQRFELCSALFETLLQTGCVLDRRSSR